MIGGISGAAGGAIGKGAGALLGRLAGTAAGRVVGAIAGKAAGSAKALAGRAGGRLASGAKAVASRAARATGRCLNSFPAGTMVVLADGTKKPIEKVKVGDEVTSTDPKTGKTKTKKVIAAFGGTNYTGLYQITVAGSKHHGDKAGVILATEHHLFWDAGHRSWIRVDKLKPGTKLRTPSGATRKVISTTKTSTHPFVHDLTIADTHTFYVEAGDTPILVHNCGLALGFKKVGSSGLKKFAESRGLNHYADMGADEWEARGMSEVMGVIQDGAETLHVSMAGFGQEGFAGMAKAGLGEGALMTEREMAWIGRAVNNGHRSWDTVKFYSSEGVEVAVPEPDWSTLGRFRDFL